MSEPLDKFGEFFVQNLRDKMLQKLEMMFSGASKASEQHELQARLSGLTDAQKQTVRELAERITTAGMHDLLFAIADSGGAVTVLVDGQDVGKLSDGLQGEIFGEDGWITRFSKYRSEVEIERSKWAREQIQKMTGKKDDNVKNPMKSKPDGHALSRIVGEQLSAVVFVQDYLQLQFDGPMLTLLTRIVVRSSSGDPKAEGAAGWRDALCGQITRIVKAVRIGDGDLVVDFADGSAISASIRPEDYRCAEAVQFRDSDVIMSI